MIGPSDDDRGNAQTMGALLASALVIVGAMAVGGYFLFLGGEDSQHESRYASIDYAVDDGQVVYEHRGGEPVPLDQTDVKLAANGDSVAVPLGELTDLGCVREVEAPETLTAGESVAIGFAPDCNPDSVNLIYSEDKSGQVLVGDPASASGGQGLLTNDTLSYSSNDSDVEGIRTVKIVITIDGQPTTVETDLADGSFEPAEVDGNEDLFTDTNITGDGLDDGTYDSGDTLNLSINGSETSDADSVRTFMLGSTDTDGGDGGDGSSGDGGSTSSGTYYVAGGWPAGALESDSDSGGGSGDSDGGSTGDSGLQALAGPDFTVYTGDVITFEAVAYGTGNPIESYHWEFGDGTTAEGQEVTHTYDATGNYTVNLTATDSENNTASDAVNISVREGSTTTDSSAVTAVASANRTDVLVGEDVAFDGSASDGENLTYTWDFGDGTATGETVTRSFDAAGTYTVALTVENATASDSDTVEVTVSEPTLSDGLIGHWKFDDGSGTTATDSAGSYDGTVSGASWTTARSTGEYALAFDKTDDYVSVGDPDAMENMTAFTASVWVNVDAYDASQSFFSREDDTANTDIWGLRYEHSRATVVGFVRGESGTFYRADSPGYAAGAWEHWVVTFDSGDLRLYRNGVHVATTHTGESETAASSAIVKFGIRDASNDSWPLGGELDDGRIYDRALSADEVTDLYNETAEPTADAGPNRSVIVGEEVAFDASNTTDPSDDVVEYRWDVDGDGNLDATTADPTVNHTYDAAGNYTLNVTVEDDDGNVDTDTATVEVVDRLQQGLLAHYRFDDASSEAVVDDVSDYDGTAEGDPAYVSGLNGTAMRFDGGGDNVDLPDLGHHENVTVAFWVRPTKLNSTIRGLVATADWEPGGIHVNLRGTNDSTSPGEFQSAKRDGGNIHSGIVPDPGRWYHLTMTVNTEHDRLEFYVDGQSVATAAGGTTPFNGTHVRLAAWNDSGTIKRHVNGTYEDVRIYTRELPDSEVKDLYDATARPVADAGSNRTVAVGESNTFDASDTVDPSGDVVEYRWDFDGNGTADANTTGPTVDHAYESTGTYTLTVTVEDATGNTDVDSKTVEVVEGYQDGLVAHYRFDDASSGAVVDDANGHDGTPEGDPAYVSGLNNTGMRFDGSGDNVDLPDLGRHDRTTITYWVRLAEVDSNHDGLVATAWEPGGVHFNRRSTAASTAPGEFQFATKDGGNVYSGVVPEVGRWYHVAATVDTDRDRLRFYVDGRLVGTSDAGTTPFDGSRLRIAAWNDSGTVKRYTNGTYEDVRVYDWELSEGEVEDLYNGTAEPTADAGPDHTIQAGETVTFDASGTTDPSGDVAEYRWDFDGDGSIDATTGSPTIDRIYDGTGNYTARLVVADDAGNMDTDVANVTVEPSEVFFDGFEDGNYEGWQAISGGPFDITTNSYAGTYALRQASDYGRIRTNRTFENNRKYVAHFNVRESSGDFDMFVNWADSNTHYRVRYFPAGTDNPQFKVLRVENGTLTTLASKSPTIDYGTWTKMTLYRGQDTIDVTVTDGSATQELTVTDGNLTAGGHLAMRGYGTVWFDNVSATEFVEPIADAGEDRTVVRGETVTFDASGSSDPDDTITSYEWDLDGDGTTDATGETVDHTFEEAGVYDVTLTVTDEAGNSDTDTVTVTVEQPTVYSDGFEDGDLTEWTTLEGSHSTTTSSYEGSYALRQDSDTNGVVRTDATFANNRTYETTFYVEDASYGDFTMRINGQDADTYYKIDYYPAGSDNPRFDIYLADNGTTTQLASKSPSISGGTWTTMRTIRYSNGSINVTVTDGSTTQHLSTVDTTLSSGGYFGIRGYNPIRADEVVIREAP